MTGVHDTSAATEQTLPCPFCGSETLIGDTGTCWVRCASVDCGAEGPLRDNETDAITAWNAGITNVAQQPIDPDLVQRCKELLGWSKTGLLNGGSGGAVRALADRLRPKIGDHYALNVAENQTRDDAMREIVRLAAQPPAAPVRPAEEDLSAMAAAIRTAVYYANGSTLNDGEAVHDSIVNCLRSIFRDGAVSRISAGTAELSDWSRLPRDLYVTSVKSIDGIVFDVQCCSVPMAIGPEVRYTQVAAQPQEASKP
jgi:hypothetical protein